MEENGDLILNERINLFLHLMLGYKYIPKTWIKCSSKKLPPQLCSTLQA